MNSRYEIRGHLGEGGAGTVYRAFDKNLNREVAIKRPRIFDNSHESKEITRNLLKEAMALSAIQHPHIVTVYDCGTDRRVPLLLWKSSTVIPLRR